MRRVWIVLPVALFGLMTTGWAEDDGGRTEPVALKLEAEGRVQAMQQALMQAQPQLFVMPGPGPFNLAPSLSRPRTRTSPGPKADWFQSWISALLAVGVGLVALFWLGRIRVVRETPASSSKGLAGRIPPSTRIIDHLIWKAFERQRYQLIQMRDLDEPLGVMRIISQDDHRSALVCVGDGIFFEKPTIEQCVRAMHEAQVQEGFLVSPGTFTVPAQRYAKEHHLTLVGREQFTELLSEGAMTEYYAVQLQEFRTQLAEAKSALKDYIQQLDAIRRQRNEASWYLGEERAKSAKLQTEAERITQEIQAQQQDLERFRQDAERLKKQWEESQWYLGEARAGAQHFEAQMHALQQDLDATLQLLKTGEQRFDLELTRRQTLEAELVALRSHGERRRAFRARRSDASIEVQRPDGRVVFSGIPRDISATGFGFTFHDTPSELPEALRVRLSLPGLHRELETGGRLMWHRTDDGDNQYVGGCEFTGLPVGDREAIERVLAPSTS